MLIIRLCYTIQELDIKIFYKSLRSVKEWIYYKNILCIILKIIFQIYYNIILFSDFIMYAHHYVNY